jgi:hypothetical protein
MINYYSIKVTQTSIIITRLQELLKLTNKANKRVNLMLDIAVLQAQLKEYQALCS